MKHRLIYSWTIVLLLPGYGRMHAQNLVPNPSFENYNTCPTSLSNIAYAPLYNNFPTVTDWVSPAVDGSPDYFNACAPAGVPGSVHVPVNFIGNRTARTGQGYTGLYMIDFLDTTASRRYTEDYREYIMCRMAQPLQAGRKYYVSFFVSRAAQPSVIAAPYPEKNIVLTDGVGVHFSSRNVDMGTVNKVGGAPPPHYNTNLSLPAHVRNRPGSFIADTAGWVKIQGLYTAAGGERWLTLGYFNDGMPPSYQTHLTLVPHPTRGVTSYLYVDDLCVLDYEANAVTASREVTFCNRQQPFLLDAHPGGTMFEWSTGDTTAQLAADTPGVYWVRTWGECAYYVDTLHVGLRTDNLLELGPDTAICPGAAVTLAASHAFDTYSWNTGDTTAALRVTASGTYILTVSDSCMVQSDTVEVSMAPPVSPPRVHDTAVCLHDPAPLLYAGDDTVKWYTQPGGTWTSVQPQVSTAVAGVQTFYVTRTKNGCESAPGAIAVRVLALPAVDLGADTSLCRDEMLSLTAMQDSTGETIYLWSTGDTGCCVHIRETGTYHVQVSGLCGTASDSVHVRFVPCDQCIWVPSAFTPDGDGRNDVFRARVLCPLQSFRMIIADRWGAVVFTGVTEQGAWDGSFRGAAAPVGTYFYTVEATPAVPGSAPVVLKGDLTLIR